MATATELRRGRAIKHNGDVVVVLDFQHRTPGNKRGFVQANVRNLRTGKTQDLRFSTSESIEIIPMITSKVEFSYKDGEDFVFSDPETFEMTTVNKEIVGDAADFLAENAEVTITIIEEAVALVELPSSVVMEVTEAPEGVRGDSTSNVMKTVTLETGIEVQAPLFIKTGERIRIDPKTKKYMERVN